MKTKRSNICIIIEDSWNGRVLVKGSIPEYAWVYIAGKKKKEKARYNKPD